MIFRRFHVDGFGIWRDLVVDNLGPGLNVFLAPNEGGKSTLMAFIRAVLFGFKRRGDARRYEPLRGGTHGGSIDLIAQDQHLRVQRTEGTSSRGDVEVIAADGSRFGEAKLESLLSHTTETLYENVFAFGLEELQRLDTLQADDVAGHIYSAGMGSGRLTPVAFRATLQQAMDGLYRSRGKKQPVTQMLGEIESLEERIEKLRYRPDEHLELRRQHGRLRERLRDHDQRVAAADTEHESAMRLQRAWPEYERLLAAEETLESIGIEPAQMAAMASAAEAELEAVGGTGGDGSGKRRVAVAHAVLPLETSAEAVELMSIKQRQLLGQANKIRGLAASTERLQELRRTVLDRQQQARQLRHALFNDLEQLGEGWSLDRVRAARTDVAGRDEIRQWRERIQRAETDIEAAATRASDANVVYGAVRESREQISRSTLMVSWALIVLSIAATAIIVPPQARLVSTASILSVGLLLGTLITWLHVRGLRLRRSEQSAAALRESELWQAHDDAKDRLQGVLQDWKGWLRQERLPADLSTQGALDLIERIRQTQALDQRATDAEATVSQGVAELQSACMSVLLVLEELDRQAFDLRYDALKMVDPLLATIEELQAELQDVEAHRERIRRVLDDHAQSRAALRALAGEEGLVVLRRRLASGDSESLARATGEAKGKLQAARTDRDALAENLGALRQQIEALENDAELGIAMQSREARRAALMQAVREWSSQALAAALYDEAKRKYEAERQPEVLQLASRYLERMTDGRYGRVIAPLGENRLEVERADSGERLAPAALSRGTGEQLYLAMRLALARAYGAQVVALPLVADDILVNFDDDRARATARLLHEFAEEGQQILAFTCHRHLAATFERASSGGNLRTLPVHA